MAAALVLSVLPAQAVAAQTVASPTLAASAPAAPAESSALRAAVPRVGAAGNDYATDAFGDPWDFGNDDDMILNFSGTQKITDLRMQDGMVSGQVNASSAFVSPVWGGYNDGILAGRDATLPWNQVDAARYDAIALHLYSDVDQANGAYFSWFRCSAPAASSACGGNSRTFDLREGWNTYVVPLGARGSGAIDWAGKMNGLRLVFAKPGANIALDWARLFDRASGTRVSLPGLDDAHALAWDANGSDADNTRNANGDSAARAFGIVPRVRGGVDPTRGAVVSGSTADLSFLPAGTYRIGVVPINGSIAWSTITLDSSRPRLITPNEVGDKDYATTVQRNPWDFNSSADIDTVRNATASFAGGQLNGRNAGPKWNDPNVFLKLAAGGIDGRIYRNLTITTSYSGAANLGSGPGGGSMARVMWRKSNNNTAAGQTSSRDVITYPGKRTITLDLGQSVSTLIGGGPSRYPFVSADKVTQLRWDPNEDPATGSAARAWTLYDMQLRSDFTADGYFPITWMDDSYAAGGMSRVSYSTTRGSCTGSEIGRNMPVNAGKNTTIWNTRNIPAGRYYVCLEITRNGSTVKRPATGPIVITHAAGRPAPPSPPKLTPLVTRAGTGVKVAWSSGTGTFTGYQVQDVIAGTLNTYGNTTKNATYPCPNGKGRAQFQIRTYGPGGVSAWSPRSNTLTC